MNSNQPQKIQNPETTVPQTPQMNERDFVNDLLATEKYMTSSYSTALNEASNQAIYQDLATIFKETQDCQRNLYNLMFKHGWYALEQEENQKLDQAYQKFSGYQSQLPYTVQ
ncbi:spore coat protein [Halobacillus litoralis]|uniref:Spore coat protein n=1 Tax=Halobacillus litoralis TaxID=45668 RepID=A0A845DTY0_9BACI|nr:MULTISPECIES: spore coat protein [Halobacillus]MCA1024041.1 spore coat protein [Halobacillus litoralis]MYL21091.1 spore coat protein [Halobacillus litoralis]MYL31373.1 spore coat protein [Halobacillus halophilus]MYL38472.1 spore coat protein [Halobacillus litoralis]